MPQLSHTVFFTLKNGGESQRHALLEAGKQYLTGHEGLISFAMGTRTADLNRDVNDRDYDVSLHTVFETREAHDVYQDHPRHLEFIAQQKDNWSKVRVFDSDLV